MFYFSDYESPIGMITIASDGDNLIGLWFERQKYFKGNIKEDMYKNDDLQVFADTKKWLDEYFKGKKPCISDLHMAPIVSKFASSVLDILIKIPYGQVTTYLEIANTIACIMKKERMSAQAVGGAIGHNPISIIIPCHRVVGTNGSLTGYAGGIDRKIWLLRHEGVDVSKLSLPKNSTV